MANINQTPRAQVQKGYSGFDLSHSIRFSSSTGMLLPVMYDLLYPNDKINLGAALATRTMDIDSAAFADIYEHLDFFFVPLTQIYSFFDSFIYGIQDINTSLGFNGNGQHNITSHFPLAEMSEIADQLASTIIEEDEILMSEVNDIFGLPLWSNVMRLNDLLDLGLPYSHQNVHVDALQNPYDFVPYSLNMSLLCAYQKIYMDYYRDTNYFANNANCYNLDRFKDADSFDLDDYDRIKDFFQLRYRRYENDFFTNRYPTPLFNGNDPSALDSSVDEFVNSVTGTEFGVDSSSASVTYGDLGLQHIMNSSDTRAQFALEKFLEVNRRVSKHYDSLTKARFGVSPNDLLSGEVLYLGSHDSSIQIRDVVSTAATDKASLGEIGGKGYGASHSRNILFKAPCHGILMCIYSSSPRAFYDLSHGVNRINSYHFKDDYFTPEFDNLGMQMFDARIFDTRSSGILGWQYRYSETKQKVNKNTGAFLDSLHYWTTQKDVLKSDDFVTGRFNLVSPYDLDNIMLVPFRPGNDNSSDYVIETENQPNTNIKNMYDRDPLIHELVFSYKKFSKQNVYSLPSL